MALRETGTSTAAAMLVEAARLAETEGDHRRARGDPGSLDVESLWAGYDWNLHDPRVVAPSSGR